MILYRILAMKRYGKFEAKGRKVKNNPQQYASTGAIHQVVSFKGSEHTQSYPKKPSKYQDNGTTYT